jgi:hypothetical protein
MKDAEDRLGLTAEAYVAEKVAIAWVLPNARVYGDLEEVEMQHNGEIRLAMQRIAEMRKQLSDRGDAMGLLQMARVQVVALQVTSHSASWPPTRPPLRPYCRLTRGGLVQRQGLAPYPRPCTIRAS